MIYGKAAQLSGFSFSPAVHAALSAIKPAAIFILCVCFVTSYLQQTK
jgi:hypothetical protein